MLGMAGVLVPAVHLFLAFLVGLERSRVDWFDCSGPSEAGEFLIPNPPKR